MCVRGYRANDCWRKGGIGGGRRPSLLLLEGVLRSVGCRRGEFCVYVLGWDELAERENAHHFGGGAGAARMGGRWATDHACLIYTCWTIQQNVVC